MTTLKTLEEFDISDESIPTADLPTFKKLGLAKELLTTLEKMGYETPTPVQAESIPLLLKGSDLVAQAETGTGKTAAFALPTLMQIDPELHEPQALILAPTRELAIQVAAAFQSYAKHIKDFSVLPIYGGQSYTVQLNALRRGVHVVVGTPGRVMDHLRSKKLSLDSLKVLILDEADEMLKMGFQQDVEWILEQIPGEHQTALFSATMPAFIKKLSAKYLNNPEKVHVVANEKAIPAITQYCAFVSPKNKIEALTRFLEVEDCDAAIVFVKTKTASQEVADKLSSLGYAVAALNGDIKQSQREVVINKLKKGQLDIVVATDVAARGIDVPRIDLVVNYDAPHDTESYVHRIGRTGRAGRKGNALLFISPREKHLLRDIERVTKQPVTMVVPPSVEEISSKQLDAFTTTLLETIQIGELDDARALVSQLVHDNECTELDIAAALVTLTYQPAKNVNSQHEVEWVANNDSSDKPSRGRRPRSEGERRRAPSGDRRDSGERRRAPSGERRGDSGERRRAPSFDRGDSGERRRAPSGERRGDSGERRRAPSGDRRDSGEHRRAPSFDRSGSDERRSAPRGDRSGSGERRSAPRGDRSGSDERRSAPRSDRRAPSFERRDSNERRSAPNAERFEKVERRRSSDGNSEIKVEYRQKTTNDNGKKSHKNSDRGAKFSKRPKKS